VKDASEPIVEALNTGQPITSADREALQRALDRVLASVGSLQEELDQLPSS
jgi:hypothetical protein